VGDFGGVGGAVGWSELATANCHGFVVENKKKARNLVLLNLDSLQLAIGEADFITSSQSSAVFAQEPLGLSHL